MKPLALAAWVVVAGLAGAAPARADTTLPDRVAAEPATPDPLTSEPGAVTRSFYRSMSYQVLSSLDDFLFGYVFAGGATAATALAVGSAVSEMAVNYLHDLGWSVFAITPEDEDHTRQTRTATFSTVNALRSFAISHVVTGNMLVSVGYVAFNTSADAVVYAVNDAVWGLLWPAGGLAPDSDRIASQVAAIEEMFPSLTISVQHDDLVFDDLIRHDQPVGLRLTIAPSAP